MKSEKLTIPSTDGVQLSAVLNGDLATAHTVILFAHGWTGSKDEAYGYFKRLAENLAPQGIASLRFDARGHGETELPASMPFTVAGYCADIAACHAWLAAQAPTLPIILFGLSLGGLVAVQISQSDNAYQAIIAAAPVLNGADLLDRYVDDIGMLETDLRDVTPQTLASGAHHTLIILQGGEDDVCLPKYAEEFISHCPQARLVILPRMGHLYPELNDETESQRYYDRSAQSEDNLRQITQLLLKTAADQVS